MDEFDTPSSPTPTPSPAPAPSKPWWRSKTIWFNVAATVAGGVDLLANNLPVITPFLAPGVGAALTVGVPIANLVLRAVTKQGIHTGGGSDDSNPPPATAPGKEVTQ